MAASPQTPHQWKFFRAGGFDQVLLENGEDLLALPELDKKLWAALSCPVKGVEFDQRTLQLIDSDGDGHIRAPEILAAIEWAGLCLKDRQVLTNGTLGVPLSAIDETTEEGRIVLDAARTILSNLGKPDSGRITVEDSADNAAIMVQTRFNGDGVITGLTAEDDSLKGWIADIIRCIGSESDRSGEPGITREIIERFDADTTSWLAWNDEALAGIVRPLPDQGREESIQLWQTVKPKIEDFFLRCSMASFDSRAAVVMNSTDESLSALASLNLSEAEAEIAMLPLSAVTAQALLDLERGINPAWCGMIERFCSSIIQPLLGDTATLSSAQWDDLKRSIQPYETWWDGKVETAVTGLGVERLRQWVADQPKVALLSLVEQDLALQPAFDAIGQVERLTRYCRDLFSLANNFVSFRDFYTTRGQAIFQVGTLYLDARSFELCISVADIAKHALLANLSRLYLVYCDCVRNGGTDRITIAAAITDGDCDQLLVGRNGVFYDRQGQDWDATIVRIIEHPISIRQAFWAPYKRIGKMIGEAVQKVAAARSKAAEDKATIGLIQAGQKIDAPKLPPPAFDVGKFAGIFAAIGLALGAIITGIASMFTGFLKLAWWQMPLVVIGIVLVISIPSVVLAWLKLRQRNLGRLLDANGWAVNTRARINILFGASLTGLARLPQGAVRTLSDPFEEKKSSWKIWLFALLALVILLFVWKARLVPLK
jgi:hypothetical protein